MYWASRVMIVVLVLMVELSPCSMSVVSARVCRDVDWIQELGEASIKVRKRKGNESVLSCLCFDNRAVASQVLSDRKSWSKRI